MVYRFHDNTMSLLFSTLLSSTLLLYFIQLPILLDALAEQDSNHFNVNNTNIQNLDVKNKSFAVTTTPISNDTTTVNNTNSRAATANITGGVNVIERLSDNAKYKIQLRSNESFSFLPKKG